MPLKLVEWTRAQFEYAISQVANENVRQIEQLASHCNSLDLKNPVHVQVMLVLGWKIRELEEELEVLEKHTYEDYLKQREEQV